MQDQQNPLYSRELEAERELEPTNSAQRLPR